MYDVNTARRIVAINTTLIRNLSKSDRQEIVAEQRTLWETRFPGLGYETIARIATS